MGPEPYKNVLVFQSWGIGDMIMTTSMIRSLRKQLPHARITLVSGTGEAGGVVLGSGACDEHLIFPTRFTGRLRQIRPFMELRKRRFDLAIIATRISPYAAKFLKLFSGVKTIAGDSAQRTWGYTHWRPFKKNEHRVIANLNILKTVLPDSGLEPLFFHVDEKSARRAEEIWRRMGLVEGLAVGIHPGSGAHQKFKRFPADKFRETVDVLTRKDRRLKTIVFFGPEDSELKRFFTGADRIIPIENEPVKVVAGLISKVSVFVSGDSGLGHIAAALGVPSVTIAGPTDMGATRPWGDGNTVLKTEEPLDCMPCYETLELEHCPHDSRCMRGIAVDKVVRAIERYIR